MPSLLLNLDKYSHFPYLLDIKMTVFYRDDFLKILYLDPSLLPEINKSENFGFFFALILGAKHFQWRLREGSL